jgi:hypothetical protein
MGAMMGRRRRGMRGRSMRKKREEEAKWVESWMMVL